MKSGEMSPKWHLAWSFQVCYQFERLLAQLNDHKAKRAVQASCVDLLQSPVWRHFRRSKYFTCTSRESNPGCWVYRQTLYHVAVKAGCENDVVECLPVDPATWIRFPALLQRLGRVFARRSSDLGSIPGWGGGAGANTNLVGENVTGLGI